MSELKAPKITPEKVVSDCCDMFGIDSDEIKIPNRKTNRVVCRGFIAHFLRNRANLSLKVVGRYVGRTHSATIHLLSLTNTYRGIDPLYDNIFLSLDKNFARQKTVKICPTCGHRE